MKCSYCSNENHSLFFFHKQTWICRVCLQMKTNTILEPSQWEYVIDEFHHSHEMTTDQLAISDQLVKHYETNNILVDAVCGAGKTSICFQMIHDALSKGKTIGWMVPRRQVVTQIYHQLQHIFNQVKVSLVIGGHTDDLQSPLVVLTAHQLFRYPNYFDVLIIDEPDAFPYKNNATLNYLCEKSCKGKKVYLTATQDESIYADLVFSLDKRYHHRPLVVPKVICVFKEFYLFVLIYWIKKWKNQRILIFVPTIKKAKLFSRILRCPCVTSQEKENQAIIETFSKDPCGRLVSTSVLERGVTFDYVNVLVLDASHSVFDVASLIQIAGRVDRVKEYRYGECVFIANEKNKEISKCILKIKTHNKRAYGV